MASGKAGRTDYGEWNKRTNDLLKEEEETEEKAREEANKALGLDGKYAFSASEAAERQKAEDVATAKKAIDGYKKREAATMQTFSNVLLGNNSNDQDDTTMTATATKEESKSDTPSTVRITRQDIEAGKRVVTLCDTTGASVNDTIVLTQDLSHLESRMAAPPVQPKSYPDDAENSAPAPAPSQSRSIFGIVKLFLSGLHNCTVVVKCKIITGTVEMSHCSNVVLRIESDATVPTLQCDLSEDITIEYRDAPSGKSLLGQSVPAARRLYWGDDGDDRIFHAGVKNLLVKVLRDGYVETETKAHYLDDGAETVGNATPEEFQFVTSVVNGELVTEKVIRHGATTGSNARAMTQRELDSEQRKRETAAKMAIDMAESMIRVQTKDGKEVPVVKKEPNQDKATSNNNSDNDVVEEVYGSMSKAEIDQIVAECEQNKTRGNEAFGSGEYGQAVLLYSLALDKAAELPDKDDIGNGKKQLFPRHIVLSNRSAAFLKLGDHPRALEDGTKAQEIDPTYVKGIFRRGLALHAMGNYQQAIQVLSSAQKIEPKNKQIKQALQFAEVRMTQEMRKRMNG